MCLRTWVCSFDLMRQIYNEPADNPDDATDDLTGTTWRPMGELLITTIRQHSDNIILGPSLNYTNDLSSVPTNPYIDSNLVYVAHVYPNTVPQGKESPLGRLPVPSFRCGAADA